MPIPFTGAALTALERKDLFRMDRDSIAPQDNVIPVDFQMERRLRTLTEGLEDRQEPWVEEVERLKLVARRHNSVLKSLYGMMEQIMEDFEGRINALEVRTHDSGL